MDFSDWKFLRLRAVERGGRKPRTTDRRPSPPRLERRGGRGLAPLDGDLLRGRLLPPEDQAPVFFKDNLPAPAGFRITGVPADPSPRGKLRRLSRHPGIKPAPADDKSARGRFLPSEAGRARPFSRPGASPGARARQGHDRPALPFLENEGVSR
jgi:hypothetical protein